jgi:hypothetical protein
MQWEPESTYNRNSAINQTGNTTKQEGTSARERKATGSTRKADVRKVRERQMYGKYGKGISTGSTRKAHVREVRERHMYGKYGKGIRTGKTVRKDRGVRKALSTRSTMQHMYLRRTIRTPISMKDSEDCSLLHSH